MNTIFALFLGVSTLVASLEGQNINLNTPVIENEVETNYEEDSFDETSYQDSYEESTTDYTIINSYEEESMLPKDCTGEDIKDGDIIAVFYPNAWMVDQDKNKCVTLVKVDYTNSQTSFVGSTIGRALGGIDVLYDHVDIADDRIIYYMDINNSDICQYPIYTDFYYRVVYNELNRREDLTENQVWISTDEFITLNLSNLNISLSEVMSADDYMNNHIEYDTFSTVAQYNW